MSIHDYLEEFGALLKTIKSNHDCIWSATCV
jgi:hypothetical protein